MTSSAELRHEPRVEIALPCTLRRPVGRPIDALTVNVGASGMLVSSARPLTVDEPLDFELATPDVAISGQARVLRHQQQDVYALGFERLAPPLAAQLGALAGA